MCAIHFILLYYIIIVSRLISKNQFRKHYRIVNFIHKINMCIYRVIFISLVQQLTTNFLLKSKLNLLSLVIIFMESIYSFMNISVNRNESKKRDIFICCLYSLTAFNACQFSWIFTLFLFINNFCDLTRDIITLLTDKPTKVKYIVILLYFVCFYRKLSDMIFVPLAIVNIYCLSCITKKIINIERKRLFRCIYLHLKPFAFLMTMYFIPLTFKEILIFSMIVKLSY